MLLFRQQAGMRILAFEAGEGAAPSSVGFGKEYDVGGGAADAFADRVFVGVFLQHVEEQDGEAGAFLAGQGGIHLQRAAPRIGPEIRCAGEEGDGIGQHQARSRASCRRHRGRGKAQQ